MTEKIVVDARCCRSKVIATRETASFRCSRRPVKVCAPEYNMAIVGSRYSCRKDSSMMWEIVSSSWDAVTTKEG